MNNNRILFLCMALLCNTSTSQQFLAVNNQSTNQGAVSDELIVFDFETTGYSTIGVIGQNLNLQEQTFDGLAWAEAGSNSMLIGAVSAGTMAPGVFEIHPHSGDASYIGDAPEPLRDLAWNPVDGKVYGIGAQGIWRDDNGDFVPETFLDVFDSLAIDLYALGIDDLGRLFVVDRESNTIYRIFGTTLAIWHRFSNPNFVRPAQHGFCLDGGFGYHAHFYPLIPNFPWSRNYRFDSSVFLSYEQVSQFPNLPLPSNLPVVQVGDLVIFRNAPGPTTSDAEAFLVKSGTVVQGGLPEIEDSDDEKLIIRRAHSSIRAEIVVDFKTSSPISSPTRLDFTFESSILARGEIAQSVSIFNYESTVFEELDARNRSGTSDVTITVSPSLDLSRFVNTNTGEIICRATFNSPNPRSSFLANIDEVTWELE